MLADVLRSLDAGVTPSAGILESPVNAMLIFLLQDSDLHQYVGPACVFRHNILISR